VVLEELLAVVEASFPALKWDKMAWDFPEHLEIDGDNPGRRSLELRTREKVG